MFSQLALFHFLNIPERSMLKCTESDKFEILDCILFVHEEK